MARFRGGWRTSEKDLREYVDLQYRAENHIWTSAHRLMDYVGMDYADAYHLLPSVTYAEPQSVEELHGMFFNRADFDREKSRLRGIIRAAEGTPRKGVVPVIPDFPSQLTSFYVGEGGEILESQYMRNVRRAKEARDRREQIAELEAQGVEFERVPVLNPETGRPMYDENRHKIMVEVPKTPQNLNRYRDVIEHDPALAIDYEDLPEDATMVLHGDTISVDWLRSAKRTARLVYDQRQQQRWYDSFYTEEASTIDKRKAEGNQRYFENYKMLMDVTMPNGISDELGGYIDAVLGSSPETQDDIYSIIDEMGEEAATIEYFYYDMADSLPARMTQIINFWREKVAPELGMGRKTPISQDEVSDMLQDFGYDPEGTNPMFGEYQRRRPDEPKTQWRKDIRSGKLKV